LSPWCILYQQTLPAEPQRQARAEVCLHGHVCEELPRLAVIVLREDGFQLALAPRVRPWVLVHSLGQAVLLLHSLQFRPRGLQVPRDSLPQILKSQCPGIFTMQNSLHRRPVRIETCWYTASGKSTPRAVTVVAAIASHHGSPPASRNAATTSCAQTTFGYDRQSPKMPSRNVEPSPAGGDTGAPAPSPAAPAALAALSTAAVSSAEFSLDSFPSAPSTRPAAGQGCTAAGAAGAHSALEPDVRRGKRVPRWVARHALATRVCDGTT